MTLDERIQALTETVELLALMHKDNEKRFQEAMEAQAKRHAEGMQAQEKRHAEGMQAHAQRIALVEEAVLDIKDLMNRMGRILEHHDISIDDHEDRIDRLEHEQ